MAESKKGAASGAAPTTTTRRPQPPQLARARQERAEAASQPTGATTATVDRDLVDLEPEVSGDDGADLDLLEEWDGKSTRIKLVRAALRDNHLAGPGLACIDCGSKTHHFHLRASKDSKGLWVGPEAVHASDLIASGIVADTLAARARDVQQAAVEVERGVHAPIEYDGEGKVVRRPFVELAELSMKDHQLRWRGILAGGPKAVVARERAERREAVGEMEKFAAAMRTAIFGSLNPEDIFTGAARARAVDGVPITNSGGTPPPAGEDLPSREEE